METTVIGDCQARVVSDREASEIAARMDYLCARLGTRLRCEDGTRKIETAASARASRQRSACAPWREEVPSPAGPLTLPGSSQQAHTATQEEVRMATQVRTPDTVTSHTMIAEARVRTICAARKSDRP
jgi:hypothetical protein